ncbi:MAG: RNA-binding S4 domain-containing protein [Chitinophagales bacterium]|nr:RNA-binding S4 domain-containing protein [Chitinophagales bacterium]
MSDKCRIDKWLWAVRLFKTRTLATDAVSTGKVKVNDESVKPSYALTSGKIITVRKGVIKYQYRVLALIEKRISASLVVQYCEDITPEEEKLKLITNKNIPSAFREKGEGRPTKKERRELDDWMSNE